MPEPEYPTPVHQRHNHEEERKYEVKQRQPRAAPDPTVGVYVLFNETFTNRQPDGNNNNGDCLAGAFMLPPGNINPLNVPPNGERKLNHGGNESGIKPNIHRP